MVTLAGLQNVVAGGGSNDGQGDGAAIVERPAIRGWTLKSTRRVATNVGGCATREKDRVGRRVGSEREGGRERERTRENLRPPVNSYRTSYRAYTYVHACVSTRVAREHARRMVYSFGKFSHAADGYS